MHEPRDTDEITASDHDLGYKDVEVERRSGDKETVRLTAPPWRIGEKLIADVQRARDPFLVLLACLPEDRRDLWLQKLVPTEISRLNALAWHLSYGTTKKKQLEDLGKALLPFLTSTPPADSKASSSLEGSANAT